MERYYGECKQDKKDGHGYYKWVMAMNIMDCTRMVCSVIGGSGIFKSAIS